MLPDRFDNRLRSFINDIHFCESWNLKTWALSPYPILGSSHHLPIWMTVTPFWFKLCRQAAKHILHYSQHQTAKMCMVFWLKNSSLRFNRWKQFNLLQSGEQWSSNLCDSKYPSTGPNLEMEKHLLCAGGQKQSLAILLIVQSLKRLPPELERLVAFRWSGATGGHVGTFPFALSDK